MNRTKTVTSIDNKITKVQNRIIKAKARYEALCRELSLLFEERDAAQGRELVKALKSSNKTYKEVMTFLGR